MDATTLAAFIVPVKTSRAVAGFVVPTPTFPFAPTKRAVDPVVVWALNTLPPPNCLTVSAFADAALPLMIVADEFIRVATPGTPWLNELIYSEQTLVCAIRNLRSFRVALVPLLR